MDVSKTESKIARKHTELAKHYPRVSGQNTKNSYFFFSYLNYPDVMCSRYLILVY
jgi:hypothetical protein